MAEDKEYILYTHTNVHIGTVSAFLADELSLVKMDRVPFLNYKALGISNLQRIWEKYNSIEQEENRADYLNGNLLFLKTGTVLAIPKNNLNRELISIMGKNQVIESKDFTTFLADKLKELQDDPNYVPVLSRKVDNYTILQETVPEISVWIWVRSLNSILDITPFIENISTTIGEDGGSFNIGLPPTTVGTMQSFNKGYLSDGVLHQIKEGQIKRSDFFFHKYISNNDVVFIRFEALKLEKDRLEGVLTNTILESQLPNKVYDMIGLVDSNSISSEFSGNNVSISVSGRDLIKLFQEDNCFYFPVTLTVNLSSNVDAKEPIIQRTVASGGTYDHMVTKGFRSVRASLEFIINVLANIEVTPNSLFSFYKNKSTRFPIEEEEKEIPLNGIWQIVKLLIDSNVSERRVADDSFSMPDGDLQGLLTKVCQKPFVEYLVDTYGDQWYLIARRPPFTKSAIVNYIDNHLVIDINEADIINENLSWNVNHIYSWYRINFQSISVAQQNESLGDVIPAIFFPEYARIWGNKKLEVVNNYIPSMYLSGTQSELDINYTMEQAFDDYSKIIESHLYLPFTRNGSLTIVGDRRIKRGTFIRHKGTDEIFYVNGVQNNFSISGNQIDRSTTLELIRGMKEEFIKGVSKSILTDGGYKRQKVGYFEIADTALIKKYFADRSKDKEKGNVGVQLYDNFNLNLDVFKFFLERKQFD